MEVSEAKRLRALEEENSRLKRLVADQAVQIHILKEVNAKSGEPVCKTTGCEDECARWHWQSGSGVQGAGTVAQRRSPRQAATGTLSLYAAPPDHAAVFCIDEKSSLSSVTLH